MLCVARAIVTTPDGDISILDAFYNSSTVPLNCLGIYTYHLGQGVESHISDVVVPA